MKTHEILQAELNEASLKIKVGAIYAHFKNQDKYMVIKLAFLEETEELCVVYQSVDNPALVFVQPLARWLTQKDLNGTLVDRFTKLKDL